MDSALPKGIWVAIVAAVGVSMFGIHYSMRSVSDSTVVEQRQQKKHDESQEGPIQVILDPGHGGSDGGTVVFSLLEKELALDLSLRVRRALKRRGIHAILTREGDRDVELAERVAIGRKHPGIPFVSIHLNRFKHASVRGAEVYVMDGKPVPLPAVKGHSDPRSGSAGLQWIDDSGDNQGFFDRRGTMLAEKVITSMTADGKLKNRGVRQRKLFIVEHAPPPAVLVECGYLSNPSEARNFSKAAFRESVAESIAEGIATYLAKVEENPMYGFKRDSAPGAAVLTIK